MNVWRSRCSENSFGTTKYKLNTGFVGTPLLCNVLTEHGMTDLAYRLLLNEEYPGWLHEVKLGGHNGVGALELAG